MGESSADWPYRRSVEKLARKLVTAIGRVDDCRVKDTAEGMETMALSRASVLSSTSEPMSL